MFKWCVVVLLAATGAFAIGTYYGYEKGVANYVAYDAPGRIALYDAAIKSDEPKVALRSMAVAQAKLMASLENSGVTFPPLLHLPATKGMDYSYQKYAPVVKQYLE
ncbi:hypothetical protein [uncultured Microbulbifer sp.]|uniref:hypothetical protein n=1 Tax=uncultured Microbulbifer sp. TaxID=348147 RepID=UPI0025F9004E|nr:hypothetical protein [uncultured Microbulbifer sp.]